MSKKQMFVPWLGDALIVVDVQNDFLPGGALAVPDGDKIIPPLNEYLRQFEERNLPIFATRDWHPPDHSSFKPQGGLWPVHCVAGTEGAAFPAALALPPSTTIVSKGGAQMQHSYSGFGGTDLAVELHRKDVKRVFIGGLATEYCVLNTALDALHEGFAVVLLEDAISAIDVHPNDGLAAIESLRADGVELATLEGRRP